MTDNVCQIVVDVIVEEQCSEATAGAVGVLGGAGAGFGIGDNSGSRADAFATGTAEAELLLQTGQETEEERCRDVNEVVQDEICEVVADEVCREVVDQICEQVQVDLRQERPREPICRYIVKSAFFGLALYNIKYKFLKGILLKRSALWSSRISA